MSYPWQLIVGNRQDDDGDDRVVSMNAFVGARLVKRKNEARASVCCDVVIM